MKKYLVLDVCALLVDWYTATFTMENHTLTNLASLGTVISLIVGFIVIIVKQGRTEKRERDQASSNLYRELQDTVESLDRKKFSDGAISFTTIHGNEIFFMNRILNHDFYDSLISSGKINFLIPKLQQQIQNIFRQIKMHNEYLDLGRRMKDETGGKTPPEKAYSYYEWMDENEVKLLKDIPIMQEKLKKDFKVTPL